MSRREPSTHTLREFGRGFTAASSTRAVWARNFGLAFMALLSRLHRGERRDRLVNASLRRHYPHQVPRVCSHPASAVALARTPTLLHGPYPKRGSLASVSTAGTHCGSEPTSRSAATSIMPPGRGSAWLRALRRKGEVAEILPNLWPIG